MVVLDKATEARCDGGRREDSMQPPFVAGGAPAGGGLVSIVLAVWGWDEPDEPLGRAASAVVVTPPLRADGLLPGMRAFRGGHPQAANPICANPKLSYFGG